MKIAYATTFDARDVHNWSGTPYHMSHTLKNAGVEIEYIGSLKRKLPPFFKWKQVFKKWACDQRESPRFNRFAANHYSQQVMQQLKSLSVDAILAPLINPIAYLDCKQPIILWTDALYAALLGFYPPFFYHSPSSMQQGNEITAACLSRASLAIFSSDWAARSALELYGISKEKVKVVPFGANIDSYPNYSDIQTIIKKRSCHTIQLLFLAKSWERKGGDIALAVAKTLHDAGHAVKLTIVGYTPTLEKSLPYVDCLGFISKQSPEGQTKIKALLSNSHFLILPSRADACPMVFAEANSFGLPCLTSYVGGISTAITNNINGMMFALDAPTTTYCDHIVNRMQDRKGYETLALSSYNEFITRLNWKVATEQVKKYIKERII